MPSYQSELSCCICTHLRSHGDRLIERKRTRPGSLIHAHWSITVSQRRHKHRQWSRRGDASIVRDLGLRRVLARHKRPRMDRLALCEQIRVLLPGRLRRFEPLCSRTIMRRAVLDRYLRNTHHNRGDVTRRSGERVMCAMTSSNECYVRTRTCTRTYKRPRKPHTYTHKKYPNFKIHTHTLTHTP